MSDQALRHLQRQWRESGLFSDFREWALAASRAKHLSGNPHELSDYIANKLAVYVNKMDHPTSGRWVANVPRSAYGAGENVYVPTTLAFQRKDTHDHWTYTGWGIGVALGFPEMWYSISSSSLQDGRTQRIITALISEFLDSLGFMPRASRFEDL